MAISFTVVAAAVYLLFSIVKQIWPDFPLDFDVVLGVCLWLLARAGVEVLDAHLARFMNTFRARFAPNGKKAKK